MPKNLIIIIVIVGVIFLGFIWLTAKEESLSEKEFYTREDLKYIEIKPGTANIYYMWMAGCSNCAALDKWFKEIKENYSIKVYKFDISRESVLFRDMLEVYNVPMEKRGFVPTIFVHDRYFVGFNPEEMEKLIKGCLEAADCVNPCDKLK